jgi:hypothetical protein
MSWFDRLFGARGVRGERERQNRPVRRRAILLLESLEERAVPTIQVPAPGTVGPAIITGTNGNDSLAIRMAPGDPSTLQLSDNGGSTWTSTAIANLTSVTATGLAGADTFTIDNGNGLVGTSLSLPIVFNGGPGADTLVLQGTPGGPAITETYSPGTSTGSGTIINNNSIIQQNLSFTGVEQIVDTVPANQLVINCNNASNYVQILNGGVYSGLTSTRVVGLARSAVNNTPASSNDPNLASGDVLADMLNQAFTPIDATNKRNLFVNGGGANNAFILNNPRTAANLTTLSLNGGVGGRNLGMERVAPPGVLLSSSNFIRVDSTAPSIFIDELYEMRLFRAPSVAEVASWQNVLNSSNAQNVANGIERSQEARTNLVNSWYFRYLGRLPVGNEAQGWVNSLLRGNAEENVLARIVGSAEFFSRAEGLFNTGSANGNFISALYLLVLNRTASSGEIAQWVNVLNTSTTAHVALGFLTSTEFRTDLFTAFYINILHRPPDQGGLTNWVNSTRGFTRVRLAFLGSQEFINNG